MTGEGPGQALFRFVRHWAKRAPGTGTASGDRGRDVLVCEAVHALAGAGEVTVNHVAAELGLDQSGASRMVSRAVGEGYLETAASRVDARRRALVLTPAGRDLLDQAHVWQEEVFDRLTADWTGRERAEFHRSLLRLVDPGTRPTS